MGQEDASHNRPVVPSPPPKEDGSGGPPVKPWGVAALVIAIVGSYSYVFAFLDKSELPHETLTHWLYWLLLGAIGLLGAAWAFLVRNKKSWLDTFIIVGLTLAALGAFSKSGFVGRDSIPPESQYTVAIFKFASTTDSTKNAAENLRQGIIHKLREEFGEKSAVDRPREVKGGIQDENLNYLRKWARRGGGSHLAVWIEMRVDADGQHYVGTAYFLKITPFGKEINGEELGVFGESRWWSKSFSATPVGSERALGEEVLQGLTDSVAFCRELANYQRGDYDAVLSKPPVQGANSEYYAGKAAYNKALHSMEAFQLSEEAINHFSSAIVNHAMKTPGGFLQVPDDLSTAMYYKDLGQAYFFELITARAQNLRQRANDAASAFHDAGEIFHKIGRFPEYVYQLCREADSLLELSKLDSGVVAIGELNRAKALIEEALRYLKPNSLAYAEAKNTFGMVFSQEDLYEDAINAFTEALNIFTKRSDTFDRVTTLIHLGTEQAAHGIFLGDESKFKDGMSNLEKAALECQAQALDHCYKTHLAAGRAELSWAKHWNRGSLRWTAGLDRALKEYSAGENFLSKKEQPQVYAELKRSKAEAYTERALGEAAGEGQPLPHLESALGELSAGIEALTVAGRNAAELYKERAECYRRLATYSSIPSEKQKYRKLRQGDEKKLRVSSHPWPAPNLLQSNAKDSGSGICPRSPAVLGHFSINHVCDIAALA